jgi:hypothetical protein
MCIFVVLCSVVVIESLLLDVAFIKVLICPLCIMNHTVKRLSSLYVLCDKKMNR